MKKNHWLVKKFEELIGPEERFKTKNEMAAFLGLGETTRTRLFNFLDGSDTRYMAIFEWKVVRKATLILLKTVSENQPSPLHRGLFFVAPRLAHKIKVVNKIQNCLL